jgi:hypothetical protein
MTKKSITWSALGKWAMAVVIAAISLAINEKLGGIDTRFDSIDKKLLSLETNGDQNTKDIANMAGDMKVIKFQLSMKRAEVISGPSLITRNQQHGGSDGEVIKLFEEN